VVYIIVTHRNVDQY
jgi:hypothetical protein